MNLLPLFGFYNYLANNFPEELDPSLKPRDSARCIGCRNIKFDFIIAGAGSAGCVVANRLSANPNWKVLLIEAGGDEDYFTDTPVIEPILIVSKYAWQDFTVRQPNACQVFGGFYLYAGGQVMGGSSTINGMFYVRGNSHDYDDWEAMGNHGWSYKDVFPYFLKLENMTIPELAVDTEYHSTKGPLYASYSRDNLQIYEDIIRAGEEMGLQRVDYNGPTQIGIAHSQYTIKGSTRYSTSKAYLNPIRNRKNLIIFKNTKVIKIIFNNSTRTADGVTCITAGTKYNVYATREIIISAGSINTPKLLMLSGIGPKEHLEEMNIPLYSDLPVGKNLMEHPGTLMLYSIDKSALLSGGVYTHESMLQYAKYRKGPLTSPSHETMIFWKGPNSTITEAQSFFGILTVPIFSFELTIFFTYVTNFVPIARGTVKLKSISYLDPPIINPNLLDNDEDKALLRWTVKQTLQLLESSILSNYSIKWLSFIAPECFLHPYKSDQFYDCYIKTYSMATFHASGTCRMGSPTDINTVVDPNLLVHTTKNLRVIDASVIPKITRGNTHIPTIMIAEKGSDKIRCTHENTC